MDNEEKVNVYVAIKEIVDQAEKHKHVQYQMALENNWLADYTAYAEKVNVEAYNKIVDLIKD
jgi:hypothetical protein